MPTEVVFPVGLRAADANVQFAPIDIARSVPMDQGEMRRRPRFRSVPQAATVSWRFEQAAFDTFWDWYEDELLAGEREFDVQLERQGGPGAGDNGRLQWWTAQFIETPKHQVLSGYRYIVSAKIMLRGAPFDARTPLGVRASGTDGDEGFWRPGSSPITAGGVDGDGGGWTNLAAGDPILAAGVDGDAGGWTHLNLPIRAGGVDGDDGQWFWANGIVAAGVDADDGGWVGLSLPSPAGGIDGDDGGWAET